MNHTSVRQWFTRFATAVAVASGSVWAALLALGSVVVWLVLGPVFGFSDTWQLWANTSTTIITYLLVFVIQNTQLRDSAAVHIKLDEIVRALPEARTALVLRHLEDASDEELARFKAELERLASRET